MRGFNVDTDVIFELQNITVANGVATDGDGINNYAPVDLQTKIDGPAIRSNRFARYGAASANCSSSVEPFSAVVEMPAPVTAICTSSKYPAPTND